MRFLCLLTIKLHAIRLIRIVEFIVLKFAYPDEIIAENYSYRLCRHYVLHVMLLVLLLILLAVIF